MKKRYPLLMEEIGRHSWAITNEALEAILRVADQEGDEEETSIFHAAKEEMDALAEAGEKLDGLNYTQIREDGTAIVAVTGPIIPRATWLSEASGITSIDKLHADLDAVQADPMVQNIVMVYDTPGGAITGVAELASAIKASEKPVTAYVYGLAASAGYWLASAADRVISSPTGMVGSIGVVASVQVSKDEDSVKIISSQSPRKQADASTEEGREVYQKVANKLAQVFIDTVASYRGVSSEAVESKYGKGAVVVAADAMARTMIDGVGTLKEVLTGKLEKIDKLSSQDDVQALGQPTSEERENSTMPKTLKELLVEHPEIQGDIDKIVHDAKETGAKEARASVDKALVAINSEAYPAAIKAMAAKVATGDLPKAHLEGAMAAHDAQVEAEASQRATEETETIGDTPPEGSREVDNSGVVTDEDSYQAALNDLKEQTGMETGGGE